MTNVWCELECRYKEIDGYCDTEGILEEEVTQYCSKCNVNCGATDEDDYDAYDNILRQLNID